MNPELPLEDFVSLNGYGGIRMAADGEGRLYSVVDFLVCMSEEGNNKRDYLIGKWKKWVSHNVVVEKKKIEGKGNVIPLTNLEGIRGIVENIAASKQKTVFSADRIEEFFKVYGEPAAKVRVPETTEEMKQMLGFTGKGCRMVQFIRTPINRRTEGWKKMVYRLTGKKIDDDEVVVLEHTYKKIHCEWLGFPPVVHITIDDRSEIAITDVMADVAEMFVRMKYS